MVMLDDATLENGCMHMIPGSHRLGYLDHAGEDGRFSGACRDHGAWHSHPSQVAITPRAGGISIHHGHTLHASGPNNSGHPRRGLVLNYRAADAYQLADHVFADTGLMVSGSFRGNIRMRGGTIPLPHFHESWNRMTHGSAWNQVGAFAAVKNRENTSNCLS
jgi:phytanoyl-CoA hydroxylase